MFVNAKMGLSILAAANSGRGGIDFSALAGGSQSSPMFNAGGVTVALKQAEANESKELASVAKRPDVVRDLARYEKVLKESKTLEQVLDDPIARRVLLKANGLGAHVDSIALAKKALMSDPDDPNSLAVRLSTVDSGWLEFVKTYNIAKLGLDRLYPQQDGFEGKWRIAIEREDEPYEALLEVSRVKGAWKATIDGVGVPARVENGVISLTYHWTDAEDRLHTTILEGKLGKNGLSGDQLDDKKRVGPWSATPYYANALEEVRKNYIAETRLDMLDQRLPGLGSAILFKRVAKDMDSAIKILGNALGREVVITALGLPKQIALQSIEAQQKALLQRLDPSKLAKPDFVDRLVTRYLIQLNGGTTGLTV